MFIKHWGIFGTILATAVSRLLTQWYDAYILFKCALKSSFRNHYIRYWLYIILFIICSFITNWISDIAVFDNKWIGLIYKGIICLIVPTALALLFTCWSEEFKYTKGLFCGTIKRIIKK